MGANSITGQLSFPIEQRVNLEVAIIDGHNPLVHSRIAHGPMTRALGRKRYTFNHHLAANEFIEGNLAIIHHRIGLKIFGHRNSIVEPKQKARQTVFSKYFAIFAVHLQQYFSLPVLKCLHNSLHHLFWILRRFENHFDLSFKRIIKSSFNWSFSDVIFSEDSKSPRCSEPISLVDKHFAVVGLLLNFGQEFERILTNEDRALPVMGYIAVPELKLELKATIPINAKFRIFML
jgi:hypothetical protein